MKTKNILLGIFIFLFVNPVLGQDKSSKLNYLSIGITPFNLIDPYTPTLEGVVELQVNNQVNLEAKYGLHFDMIGYLFNEENRSKKGKYYEAKFAIKYLMKKNEGQPGYFTGYLGLEYFVLNQKTIKENDWLFRDWVSYTYDTSETNRMVNGIRFKYGLIALASKNKWDIDVYIGAGVKQVIVDHKTTGELLSAGLWDEWVSPLDRREGKRISPDIIMGFKVSYRIIEW